MQRKLLVAAFFITCHVGQMFAVSNYGDILPLSGEDVMRQEKTEIKGDFTELKQVVTDCRLWVQTASAGHAVNAVAELMDQVRLAEMLIASNRASQSVIDDYVSSLKLVLVKAQATSGFSMKRVFPLVADHGFVHPGGLVSQEDVNRAKQLLAEGDERITKAWNRLCANSKSRCGHISNEHCGSWRLRAKLHECCAWCSHGLSERIEVEDWRYQGKRRGCGKNTHGMV